MRLALPDQNDPLTAGFIGSIVFHIFIVLAIVFGVPSFFEPEILPAPLGIEATIVGSFNSAPKPQKAANKTPDKPKEQPAPEKPKEKPKAETPPPPAPTPPPPPPPPEQAPVIIPDKTAPPKEEPKPEPKPKPKPPVEKPFDPNSLIPPDWQNQAEQTPAPPKPDPKPKPSPKPAPPIEGDIQPVNDGPPMTAGEKDGIRQQISDAWRFDSGGKDAQDMYVEIRVALQPDGTVTQVQIVNNRPGDIAFAYFARDARNAALKASPLKLPNGKYWPTILLRFKPSDLP